MSTRTMTKDALVSEITRYVGCATFFGKPLADYDHEQLLLIDETMAECYLKSELFADAVDLAYTMNEAYDYEVQDEAHCLNMKLTGARVFFPKWFVPNYGTGDFYHTNSTYVSMALLNQY